MTSKARLSRLSVQLLDVSIAAHKVGDMDRKAKALKVRAHVARRLSAISTAQPLPANYRQVYGGLRGCWRR